MWMEVILIFIFMTSCCHLPFSERHSSLPLERCVRLSPQVNWCNTMEPPANFASSASNGQMAAQPKQTHLSDMEIAKLSSDEASRFKLLALAVGTVALYIYPDPSLTSADPLLDRACRINLLPMSQFVNTLQPRPVRQSDPSALM
jgi:hypothetical protein